MGIGQDGLGAFRDEVRTFLKENLRPEVRDAAALQPGIFSEGAPMREWHRILYERGWVAPSWPKEWGGAGWSPLQRMIFEAECGALGAPYLPPMGLQMCGPVIIRFGTDAQKERFLPAILSGDDFWCQGYSEPQAGSDLAALKCSAVRDGDHYVINGSKIWTTQAHHANWMFMLVRTSSDGPRQAGITFLLVPLDTPGIVVTPIISMSGEHEVNQVFFDDVRVPVENRLGEENGGWDVAKYLLEFERGGGYAGARVIRMLSLLDRAEAQDESLGERLKQPHLKRKRAQIEVHLKALTWTQLHHLSGVEPGQSIGNVPSSVLKLGASELYQKVTELAFEAAGSRAAVKAPNHAEATPASLASPAIATARYLNARALSIFGGTSEIQCDIIARSVFAGQ
tara:strand:+ start:3969 stop:5159 length:1191 start_codon:yes stop_codon:yes gene_type:complete